MPTFHKITAEEYNSTPEGMSDFCNTIKVYDGLNVNLKNDIGDTIAKPGQYAHIVFIPNMQLGNIQWSRVFRRSRHTNYKQETLTGGVVFMFN